LIFATENIIHTSGLIMLGVLTLV